MILFSRWKQSSSSWSVPKLWQREKADGLRVDDEGQSRAALHHVLDFLVQLEAELAQDGEDEHARDDGGHEVQEAVFGSAVVDFRIVVVAS